MPKVLSGSRFWVVPIGLIQHHQLSHIQQLDRLLTVRGLAYLIEGLLAGRYTGLEPD